MKRTVTTVVLAILGSLLSGFLAIIFLTLDPETGLLGLTIGAFVGVPILVSVIVFHTTCKRVSALVVFVLVVSLWVAYWGVVAMQGAEVPVTEVALLCLEGVVASASVTGVILWVRFSKR